MSSPIINTYHCAFCTNLVLATTHTISTLPTRRGKGDRSFILPVSGAVPDLTDGEVDTMEIIQDVTSAEEDGGGEGKPEEEGREKPLPPHGYTTLLSLLKPSKQVIVRREEGFEKRGAWRCGRCGVSVGYEVLGEGEKPEKGEGGFDGQVLYLLRGGLMSTKVMASGKKVKEEDAGAGESAVGVWE